MPFTLVHPAAVVPLARVPWLSSVVVPSALVAGAVAPDLTYYVPLTWLHGDLNLTLTHTWTSVLWLDPVIGLVLLGVFHLLLKRPLVALLPRPAAGRVAAYVAGPAWRRPVVLAGVVVSLVVGSATHLAWDGVNDAFGYAASAALNLLGDLGGGLFLAWWLGRWWRTTPPRVVPPGLVLPPRLRARLVTGIVLVCVGWVLVHGVVAARELVAENRAYGGLPRPDLAQYVARQAAIDGVVALAVALGVYAVAWHVARRPVRRDRPR